MGEQYGELALLQIQKMGADELLSCGAASVCLGPRSWGLVQGCQFVVARKDVERLIWATWESKGVKNRKFNQCFHTGELPILIPV